MEKCDKCNNMAVWLYMPSSGQFCDEHVPRGCSCDVHTIDYFTNSDGSFDTGYYMAWKEDETITEIYEDIPQFFTKDGVIVDKPTSEYMYFCYLDENKRRYPCCEYDYDEEGFNWDDDNEI